MAWHCDHVIRYCDLTTEGGGWTLLMKATAASSEFEYAATYWSTANTLNSNDLSTTDGDAKFATFNHLPVTEYMAFWPSPASGSQPTVWRHGPFAPETPLAFFNKSRTLARCGGATPCAGMVDTAGMSNRNAASLVTAYKESAGGAVRFGYVWTPQNASGGCECTSRVGIGMGLEGASKISAGGFTCCAVAGNTNAAIGVQLYGRTSPPDHRKNPWAVVRSEDFDDAPSATEAIDAGSTCGTGSTFGNILGGISNLLGKSYTLERTNVALRTAGGVEIEHTLISVTMDFIKIDSCTFA